MTDLDTLLRTVEQGVFPDPGADDLIVVPQPSARDAAVLSFTGVIVIAAEVDRAWVRERLAPGELSEAFTPPFLGALAAHTKRRVNAIDLLLLSPAGHSPVGTTPPSGGSVPTNALSAVESDHDRVRRARRYRDDVRVWSADGGVLVLGRGLAGRWEVAIEVDEAYRGKGVGRRLAAAAPDLVPDGRPVWAQVAPGNAASVRAFLAAGYLPVGMEALLVCVRQGGFPGTPHSCVPGD